MRRKCLAHVVVFGERHFCHLRWHDSCSQPCRGNCRRLHPAIGERVDWRLAAPLGLTYLAFFAAPFAILLGISFYADSEQTWLGLDSWTKFYGDAFYLKAISSTR
jgi:hypothetical protein